MPMIIFILHSVSLWIYGRNWTCVSCNSTADGSPYLHKASNLEEANLQIIIDSPLHLMTPNGINSILPRPNDQRKPT